MIERQRVVFGMILWGKRRRRFHLAGNWGKRLLEVEAERLVIKSPREAFVRAFGNEYGSLFDDFMKEREDGGYYRDYSGALEFLRARGLVP